jgi:hypothetical protein
LELEGNEDEEAEEEDQKELDEEEMGALIWAMASTKTSKSSHAHGQDVDDSSLEEIWSLDFLGTSKNSPKYYQQVEETFEVMDYSGSSSLGHSTRALGAAAEPEY